MRKKNKPKNNSSFSMSLSEPFILWCVLACLVSDGFSAESLTWSWLKPLWEQFVLYRKAFYLNCWIVQNPELRVSKFRCVSKKPSPRSLKLQSETVLSLSLSPIIRPVLLIFFFFLFFGRGPSHFGHDMWRDIACFSESGCAKNQLRMGKTERHFTGSM